MPSGLHEQIWVEPARHSISTPNPGHTSSPQELTQRTSVPQPDHGPGVLQLQLVSHVSARVSMASPEQHMRVSDVVSPGSHAPTLHAPQGPGGSNAHSMLHTAERVRVPAPQQASISVMPVPGMHADAGWLQPPRALQLPQVQDPQVRDRLWVPR